MGKVHEEAAPRKGPDAITKTIGAILEGLREIVRAELARGESDPWEGHDYINITKREFNRLARTGAFPAVKLGKLGWRARRSALDKWMMAHGKDADAPANDTQAQDADVNAVLAGVGFELRGRR